MEKTTKKSQYRFGSVPGAILSIAIGFFFYLILSVLNGSHRFFNYNNIISHITSSFPKQIMWFFMNFTEAQFYASFFAGIGLIFGAILAWALARNHAKSKGFEICYGNAFLLPWVLASQLISLALAMFVFRYIDLFNHSSITWVATFISVVGAPPAVMLLYGPSPSALFTSSILGGLLCPPVATWISQFLTSPWKLPGVVANVSAMAITGIIICVLCNVLPWVKKHPVQTLNSETSSSDNVYSAKWFVRRVFADFSEAPFYGNEVASIFLLVGVVVGAAICSNHSAYGSGALPAIILSQFISSTVGVFLYTQKFDNSGWYATYVPVVSVAPACVLMFGATIPVALFSGVIGGILGAPVAEYLATKLPNYIHITVANVTSMAICTTVVVTIMRILPWF